MERGLRTLGLLGNTAPLCGLLGTVGGVIEAFQAIEQGGGGVQVSQLAGGIWEALLTTAIGISVALPVLFVLHALEGMADRRAQNMRALASLALEHLPHGPVQEESDAVHHREGVIHAV
jgi:biopolymer transport protein ExbB